MTKSQSIILPTEDVLAVLRGAKTQLRVPVKIPKRSGQRLDEAHAVERVHVDESRTWNLRVPNDMGSTIIAPPFYVGDDVWVRERLKWQLGDDDENEWAYTADSKLVSLESEAAEIWLENQPAMRSEVSPSAMPRWASRLTLHITAVRCERLQGISASELIHEGWPGADARVCPTDPRPVTKGDYLLGMEEAGHDMADSCDDAVEWFAKRWDSIHGPGAWHANPFVWVLSFERKDGGR